MLGVGTLLVLALACSKKSTSNEGCWVGVDTVFASGVEISGVDDIPTAFANYAVYVDSTTGEYWDGSTEVDLLQSEYVREFKGLKYWLLHTQNYDSLHDQWNERETLYVDENGVFVLPLGCY